VFDKYTYRQKTWGILLLFVSVFILAYITTFSKTIDLSNQISKKEFLLSNVDQISLEIEKYQSIIAQEQSKFKTDDITLQNLVYEKVSTYCDSVLKSAEIKQFFAPHNFALEEKTIQTCFFSVKGDFSDLLRLNEMLEKEMSFAQLASVEYKLETKKKKKELIATYYIQNVYEI